MTTDETKITTELQYVRWLLDGVGSNVSRLADHVATQNHRLDKIEHEAAKESGRAEVRREWQEAQMKSFRWMFAQGLVAAGVLSGIVFGVLAKVVH